VPRERQPEECRIHQRSAGLDVAPLAIRDRGCFHGTGTGEKTVGRAAFAIDFDARQATCPQGHASSSWNPVAQRGTDTIVITFAKATCRPCPVRAQCTASASGRRQLTVHPEPVHQAQLAARGAQGTSDFQARYALRAGVEGTIRQGVAAQSTRGSAGQVKRQAKS